MCAQTPEGMHEKPDEDRSGQEESDGTQAVSSYGLSIIAIIMGSIILHLTPDVS